MADKVKITNVALMRCGNADTIEAFYPEEKSASAVDAYIHWDNAVEATLRAHDWSFARAEISLSLSNETLGGYAYAYTMPADCVCVRYLDDNGFSFTQARAQGNPTGLKPVYFDTRLNASRNSLLIVTNQEQAQARYTAKVTAVNLYDALFADALSWQLALNIAIDKGQDTSRLQWLESWFEKAIAKAASVSSNETPTRQTSESSFSQARRV